jgi:hypothetical protein
VIAVAPTDNQAFAAQEAKPLRDGSELLAHRRNDLCHAQLALLE